MVGATVVAPDGTIVGDGWHRRAGTPHAEVHALTQAGDRAAGALLICTLEPCCHHGRTGPCVERIVAAGIKEVVAATEDPNPLVAGRGLAYLRDHGVRVTVGPLGAEARRLNAPFFTWVRHRRPFVVAKAGLSLDGCLAAAPGVRTEITSRPARREAQRLRAELDAVLVGANTVLVDDPLLTVREVYRSRPLTRVILDRRLRVPPSARVLTTLAQGPVLVITTAEQAASKAARALEASGATVVAGDGTFRRALELLAAREICSVLLEGGAEVHRAAREADMIDRVVLFIAPRALGPDGVRIDGGLPPITALRDVRVAQCGPDVVIDGYVHWTD